MSASRATTTIASLALIAMAAVALVVTAAAWAPCGERLDADGCLGALDSPPHAATVSSLWFAGLLICALCVIVALPRTSLLSARAAVVAVVAVGVVGNPMVDYFAALVAWSAYPQLWESAPGIGYVTATGLAVAGLLLLWSSASARPVAPAPRTAAATPRAGVTQPT